jgi:hypothetical protein
MHDTAPLFLFLLPHDKARGADAEADSFLAVVDCTGAVAHRSPRQLTKGHNGQADMDAFAARIQGAKGLEAFHMHLTGQELGAGFADAACSMLSIFAPDGFDVDLLETQGPNRFDVFSDGGVARTRDAVFWVAQLGQGCGAPTHIGGCVPGRRITPQGAGKLTAAMEVAKVALPPGVGLADALDHFTVGFLPETSSGHALLAQRGRLLEDIRLFPALWEGMGGSPRPVVPVFL